MAKVVADSHAAQDHDLVVEHVELRVVEALLVMADADHLVIQQRVRERAGLLPQRSPASVHGHQRPGLQAGDQADALVEEALLRSFQVLVGHPDAVLQDLDLDAAIGGAQQRLGDHLPRGVVAPFEAADQDAALGLVDPFQDAGERGLAARHQVEVGSRLRARAFDRQTAERHRAAHSSLASRPPQHGARRRRAYFAVTSVVHCR